MIEESWKQIRDGFKFKRKRKQKKQQGYCYNWKIAPQTGTALYCIGQETFSHPLKLLAITEFFLLCAGMKPRAFEVCVQHPEVTPDPRTTVSTSLPRRRQAKVPAMGGVGTLSDCASFQPALPPKKLLKQIHSCRFPSDESTCPDKC